MAIIMHSEEEIERAARVLACVPTDNRAALERLGFARSYPQEKSGYNSRIWQRSIDHSFRPDLMERRRVVQRAYLHDVLARLAEAP